MATFNGKEYGKQDLLRRVNNMKNIAQVRSSTINAGKPGGIKVFDITSGQLEFTVMESRCLDIVNLKYKGLPYNFLSKVGPVNAAIADNNGKNFLRAISGGMLYTCGFSNVGNHYANEEEGDSIFHGRLRYIPADNVSAFERWEGDEYVVGVCGEMRDNGLFFEDCVLRRSISTALGSKTITIRDEIENESFYTAPFMFMYHVNVGFPILGKGAKVYIPSKKVQARNADSEPLIDEWMNITEPVDGQPENVFAHDLYKDENGDVYACAYNAENELGLGIRFRYGMFPKIIEWRSMGSTAYSLGIMPANCLAGGRQAELDEGDLRYLAPFEKVQSGVEITVMDSRADFDAFMAKVATCVK